MKKASVIATITVFSLIFLPVYGQIQPQQIDIGYYNATYRQNGELNRIKQQKRIARKLSAPVILNEYLVVYNEDLGYFNQHPTTIIEQINAQKKFGRDNWRIPTPDELNVMEANAASLGMGDDIYMCTTHANGRLRLVSTQGSYTNMVRIGNTFWVKTNFGTQKVGEVGHAITYPEAIANIPQGYRLPTEEEAQALIYSGEAWFGNEQYYFSSVNGTIRFPYTETLTNRDGDKTGERGKYWVQGNKCITFEYRWGLYANQWGIPTERRLNKEAPQIEECGGTAHVKYVLDK